MPVDASIYSLLKPVQPGPGPLEQYGQMENLRALMGQRKLHDLQTQDLEQTMGQKKAIQSRLASLGPTETVESALPDIDRISYGEGMKLRKAGLDTKTSQATLDKTNQEIDLKAVAAHRDMLPDVKTPQEAAQWLKAGYDDPRLGKILSKLGTLEDAISRVPSDPVALEDWKKRSWLGATKFAELNKPTIHQVNDGSTITDKAYPGLGGAPTVLATTARTVTPGEKLSDERTRSEGAANRDVTMRGQNLVDERARDQAGRDKFGQPFEVTVDGKPRVVMQNKSNGDIVDPVTREPVAGLGPKIGEAAQKQQAGVANTMGALAEYRDALKKWSGTDALNPNERARMGTVYNNALLQAKEAFNLGVLNGPDYKILQEVLTDPASLKGGITSKKALDDQAQKLEEIMGRVGKVVVSTQTGSAPPAAPSRGLFSTIKSDADFNKLPSGSVFIGPDGVKRRKP